MHVIFWSGLPSNLKLIQRYIGPYKLRHWLEKHGYTAQIIDFIQQSADTVIDQNELYEITKNFITKDTLIIGLSTTFLMQINRRIIPPSIIIGAVKRIKEEYPKIKFVLGGNRAEEVSPDQTELFDAAIIGLGEDILLDLLNYYSTGNKDHEPIGVRELPHKIKFYRQPRNKKFDIQQCDFKWLDKDIILPGETLPIEISRGCIFKCKFCNYPLLGKGKYDYVRDMSFIREEMIYNYEKFKTTNYYVLDDTFNDTPTKVKAFYEMTKTLPFKIRYATYLRADLMDSFPETVPMLRDSGISGIHLGIESFHPVASKIIGKGWSSKHAKDFLPWLLQEEWNNQVSSRITMIAGLPGETREDILQSVQWFKDKKIRTWHYKGLFINKFNGSAFSSEFAKNADQYGYIFPIKDNPFYWENPKYGWTRKTADDLVKQIYQDSYAENYPFIFGSWTIISLLTVGYDYDYLINIPLKEIDSTVRVKKCEEWIDTYRKKLKEWSEVYSKTFK